MAQKMKSKWDSYSISSLRTVSYRLSSTPKEKLPLIIPQLTTLLESCKPIFSFREGQELGDGSPSMVVHKFQTQLSSLLNGRTAGERWSGIVLMKATVELGILNTSQKLATWVRTLIGILGKEDPMTTKRLCILTLTRTFMLTHTSPTLLREITTPSLPPFISACLKLIDLSNSSTKRVHITICLHEAILQSFCQLLLAHTTIFRTFLPRIRKFLLSIIAPTFCPEVLQPSNSLGYPSPSAVKFARQLYLLLNYCHPKPQLAQKWSESLSALLNETRRTAAEVFLAGGEKLEFGADIRYADHSAQPSNSAVAAPANDLGLSNWSGIHAGCERLNGLLQVIEEYFVLSSPIPITLPVGKIFEILQQILSIVLPLSPDMHGVQNTSEGQYVASREEREHFLSLLPQTHAVAFNVVESMCQRLQASSKPFVLPTLDHLEWVSKHEMSIPFIKFSTYRLTKTIVQDSGPLLSKGAVRQLFDIIRSCCNDIEAAVHGTGRLQGMFSEIRNDTQESRTGLGDAFDIDLDKKSSTTIHSAELLRAAHELIPAVLTNLKSEHIPQSLRSKMDQIMVLSRHRSGMWASVLNPQQYNPSGKATSSLLPLMARVYPTSLEIEGILRPRMPIIPLKIGIQDADTNLNVDAGHESDTSSGLPYGADSADETVEQSDMPNAVSNTTDQNQASSDPYSAYNGELLGKGVTIIATEGPKSTPVKREGSPLDIPQSNLKRTRHSSEDIQSERRIPVTVAESHASEGKSTLVSTNHEKGTKEDVVQREAGIRKDVDSDEDDFEIPPLTMEADTEDEEE